MDRINLARKKADTATKLDSHLEFKLFRTAICR
jgi:hypothetical protein